MTQISHVVVVLALSSLAIFVWRAQPANKSNTLFATQTLLCAAWVVGIANLQTGFFLDFWARFTFAVASLIPVASLAFIQHYPVSESQRPSLMLRTAFLLSAFFCITAAATDLIVYDVSFDKDQLSRKAGPLYPAFSAYFVIVWCVALLELIRKWQAARGLARARLQYLVAAFVTGATGGVGINLLFPLLTGRSTYSLLGPYFTVGFVAITAHAIIRHRLMDLRVVIHRGLTLATAVIFSLLPVAVLLYFCWPTLSLHLRKEELLLLITASVIVALLIPPTRDITRRLLDRYVYRTQANYQRTVREASQKLTDVLDLATLLDFITRTVAVSTRAEGVAVYLRDEGFRRAIKTPPEAGFHFDAPELCPDDLVNWLERTKEPVVTDELAREATTDAERSSCERLTTANWALLLPVVSNNVLTGIIALGPKLSGDPYYPQDLDLLMTLANQAGTAIKNARLYAQVVLANEYIENIVATIGSGVVAVAGSGQITMVNRAAELFTGMSAATMQGHHARALPAALGQPLLACLLDAQPQVIPELVLPGTGTPRTVLCSISPLRDPAGLVLGAVSVFSDLTPLKELEIERRRTERLAYLEVLASGIAHEIRNPLVSIKSFVQLLPTKQDDARFVLDFGRITLHGIERMLQMVDRLSALAYPAERTQHPLDLRLPITDALESMEVRLSEKSLLLETRLGERPCFVRGDHGELEQLFLNLIVNAHDATPVGGTVSIEVSHSAARVTVTIADTGDGIPPALIERIFEPFFTTKPHGSGLGLAICAGIAERHGARLHAANRPGGGAVFSVDFTLIAVRAMVTA